MKHNLKNRPNWKEFSQKPTESYTVALASFGGLCEKWFEDFEKELRYELEIADKTWRDSNFKDSDRYEAKGVRMMLNEILGEVKTQ